MFCLVHSVFEQLQCVIFDKRHLGSGDDRAIIDTGIRYPVNHHSRPIDAALLPCLEGSLDGMSARELARQRRVQVDDGEAIEKHRGQQSHPAGQHHQLWLMNSHRIGQSAVIVGSGFRTVVAFDHLGGDVGLGRSTQPVRIGLVGDHGDDLGIESPRPGRVEEGLEVAAIA